MQTFLTSAAKLSGFHDTARVLDRKRLHKQTVEGWQALLAITELSPAGEDRKPRGWVNHPVARMWRGHESHLVAYLMATNAEWLERGYKSTMREKILRTHDLAVVLGRVNPDAPPPWWMVDQDAYARLTSTHRRALLVKDYAWYSQFGWDEDPGERPPHYQYLWPRESGVLELGTFNVAE